MKKTTRVAMPRTLAMIAEANQHAVARSGGWLEISKTGDLRRVSPAKRVRNYANTFLLEATVSAKDKATVREWRDNALAELVAERARA